MNDFSFGLIVILLILMIAFLWTIVVHFKAIIKGQRNENKKLKKFIDELNSGN